MDRVATDMRRGGSPNTMTNAEANIMNKEENTIIRLSETDEDYYEVVEDTGIPEIRKEKKKKRYLFIWLPVLIALLICAVILHPLTGEKSKAVETAESAELVSETALSAEINDASNEEKTARPASGEAEVDEISSEATEEVPDEIATPAVELHQAESSIQNTQSEQRIIADPQIPEESPLPQAVHSHTWVHHDAVLHTFHHDAEYITVHHDAVTEQRWVVDSPSYDVIICTGCGAQFINGAEYDAHAEYYAVNNMDMSHGYSVTTVQEQGHYETITVSDAYDELVESVPPWDETVVDSPAYDECTSCGARQ